MKRQSERVVPAWQAYRKRRAVIPADGYYEWQPVDDGTGKIRKQPYYIHRPDGHGLSSAGLYELWPYPAKAADDPDRWLWTAVIITTDATGQAGEIHDRTPVLLPPDRVDACLDPTLTDPDKIGAVLRDLTAPALELRPVSTQVNRVANNDPHLIDPDSTKAIEPLHLSLA